MRDIAALLNSLVNIDRNSLIAILSSEAEAARQFVSAARQRTASQRAERRDAEQCVARLDRMLSFFSTAASDPGCHRATSSSAGLLNRSCMRGARRHNPMSLNIKNPETHRLAEELAKRSGKSMMAAVTAAVRERLDRVRREQSSSTANPLVAVGQDCDVRLKNRIDRKWRGSHGSRPQTKQGCFATNRRCCLSLSRLGSGRVRTLLSMRARISSLVVCVGSDSAGERTSSGIF
jgi:antitoxin VapB